MLVTSQSESVPDMKRGEGSLSADRYWMSLAAATAVVLLVAAIRWSLAHPFGIHWDESGYLNEALIDAQRLRGGILLKLAGRLVLKAFGRPPAYRFIADPLLACFGPSTTIARLASLTCWGLTGWYVFRCVRLLASRAAAAIAVLILILSPEIVAASIFLGTDTPLYLATAAMLYYLLRSCNEPLKESSAWFGLGLALTLGLLSKTSFFVIGPPALLLWFVSSKGRRAIWQYPLFPVKVAAVPLILAAPWWVVNMRGALEYGKYARGFVRNSLGPPSPTTWLRWLNSVWQCLLGHGVTLFLGIVLIAFLIELCSHQNAGNAWSPRQRIGLALCGCAGIPIVLTQLTGTNHLLRHISPAMVPLAISVAVFTDKTLVSRSGLWSSVASLPIILQLGMIVYPVIRPNTTAVDVGFVNGNLPWRAMARFEQWDWKPVWLISKGCNITSSRIAYLGGGREFNPQAIEYSWARAAYTTRLSNFAFAEVTWLWRYEDGPIDWKQIMSVTDNQDIVITAPGYAGDGSPGDNLDNQYNTEFANRFSGDPRFQSPIQLELGRFEPVRVEVFVSRSLACSPEALVPHLP